MPCNKLAVQTVKVPLPEGLFQNQLYINTIVQALDAVNEVHGYRNNVVCNDTTWDWIRGLDWIRFPYAAPTPPTQAEVAKAAEKYLDFFSDAADVRIYTNGTIEFRDGINLGHKPADAWIAAAQSAVGMVLQTIVQAEMVKALVEAGAQLVSTEVVSSGTTFTFQI